MSLDLDQCVAQILARYPDIAIEAVRPVDAGQYNLVLIVNDELIFRFPRFPEGIATLEREVAILEGTRPYVSFAIPNPIYQRLDTGVVGETFVGYRMIAGTPLWREIVASIDDDTLFDRLAGQLGAFLRQLHGVPYHQAIAYKLPVPDFRAQWEDLYQRIRAKLFSKMRPEARCEVSEHFERYLADEHHFSFAPALTHGDFGGSNILYHAERGQITGIIDFSSAGLDDPALDYAALSTYGEPFFQRVIARDPDIGALRERIRFYRGTFALQEALYGVEHDDPAAFEAGIADYR